MAFFPLTQYAELLEDVLKKDKFRNITKIREKWYGKIRIYCYDNENNEYMAIIKSNFPRFTVESDVPENLPRFKDLEKCMKKTYSREACVDIIINGKNCAKT